VIGAGVAGLAAAIDLGRAGFDVTVFERAASPGGKMRELSVAGRPMDAGPTVFTLREVFDTRALFVKHGILDAHTFVLGAAEETAEEARATLAFVDALDPDVAVFVAFLEDREERRVHRAPHRAELLALLTEEAPKRPGWVVPELSIRFGPRVAALGQRSGWKGPSWLRLAAHRRATVARAGR